jgi:serine protease Do
MRQTSQAFKSLQISKNLINTVLFLNTTIKTRKKVKKIIVIFVVALLGGIATIGLQQMFQSHTEPKTLEERQNMHFTSNAGNAIIPAFDFVAISEQSTPTVVHITTTMQPKNTQNDMKKQDPWGMFDERFFRQMPQGPSQATGSGVIITQDGYIATNNHVIDNASKIVVVLDDKRKYEAELVGADPETDLALLKIKEDNLAFMAFGNSDEIKVGEWVIAVGNPFNLNSTVTAGIVSAKGRNINLLRRNSNSQYAIENFIQTDAAVNPGNSGGALVNTQGQLIGINTAIASQTGSYSGYSFAVPVNIAKKVFDDILKYGEVKRAILGVQIRDLTSDLAEEKGIAEIKGVYIPGVVEDGAADEAGIKEGDVILAIDSKSVNKASELQEAISKYHPGDKVTVKINRKSKEIEVKVTLLSREGTDRIIQKTALANQKVLGAELVNLSDAEKQELNLRYGVKIKKLYAGVLKQKRVPEGFVITHIDKRKMYTSKDVVKALKAVEGSTLIDGVTSTGKEESYAIRIK